MLREEDAHLEDIQGVLGLVLQRVVVRLEAAVEYMVESEAAVTEVVVADTGEDQSDIYPEVRTLDVHKHQQVEDLSPVP